MGQAIGQFPIVSEQQQALGGGVKSANVEQALSGIDLFANDVTDAGAPQVIMHGGLHAIRLVENKVLEVVIDADTYPVNTDNCSVRVDTHALRGDDFSVDFNTSHVDEFFGHTAGCHACLR